MNTPERVTPSPVDGVLEEIRVAMARRRWSQSDLARELGATEHWVSRRLLGKTDLSVAELYRIAGVLEVDPRTLLPAVRVTVRSPAVFHPATFPADRLRVVGHRRATRLSLPITCPPRAA